MANILAQAALTQIKEWHAEYCELYADATDSKSPKRTEWNSAVESRLEDVDGTFVAEATKAADSFVEKAQESDDATEVMLLLDLLDERRKVVKDYLDTLFFAETTGKNVGAKSVDDIKALAGMIESTFELLLSQIPSGYVTREEIEATGVSTMKEGRNTKNGKAPSRFVWDCPGRFRNTSPGKPKGTQVRHNSVTRQLIVNGEPVEGRTLGEQCKKAIGPTFTVRQLQELVENQNEGNPAAFTDPKLYRDDLCSYLDGAGEFKLGLRLVKK